MSFYVTTSDERFFMSNVVAYNAVQMRFKCIIPNRIIWFTIFYKCLYKGAPMASFLDLTSTTQNWRLYYQNFNDLPTPMSSNNLISNAFLTWQEGQYWHVYKARVAIAGYVRIGNRFRFRMWCVNLTEVITRNKTCLLNKQKTCFCAFFENESYVSCFLILRPRINSRLLCFLRGYFL